ncbi:MAG TPA: hypothetical protein VFO18_16170 [Methylomirabilota bacterium]|nr:hypothetical protein [Methylomirabilota bacterium]
MRALALALVVALAISGCAKLKAIFTGSPEPPPAPVEPTPPPPPAVLSPQVGSEVERRLQRDAQDRIDRTERLLSQVDPKRLGGQRQESYQTIQSFLSKAKEALYARDMQRAMTLADKAFLLANELTKGSR